MHKKVLRMALHAISTVRDDQIICFFFMFEWNISKVISTIAIWDPERS